jgi:glycosyltransferase involved in cell wall biosynthesis
MEIPGEFKNLIHEDSRYETKAGRDLDTGYQAWSRGILLEGKNISPDELVHKERISLIDNYIFARKYFKMHWIYYLLVKNILSFNNPAAEINAFLKTRNIKRVDLINPHSEYSRYNDFFSKVTGGKPLVSIIIPTLNRYEYLKDVLSDLENQDYKNFEILIADQTDNPDREFYKKFNLNFNLIFQQGKGQWLARNEAIRKAKGDYLLFFDDDSRVDKDWISEHLKGLDFFNADISAGISISNVGDSVPLNYSFFRWADQFDSGNALVKREVFEKIGMFDRQFDKQRMGDGEFGLRAYLSGVKSISHPYAKRLHLKIGTGGLRQMGSWDAFRPKNFFAPRPLPSVLYLYRKYFPRAYVMNALIIGILPSLVPYKWKGKKFLYPVSAMLAVLILPFLLLQICISWRRSSAMLYEGDKIESL